MPLDYPSSPAINDTWTASNGATYTWDGTKWTVSGSGSGTAYLPLAGGTMTGGDITLFRDPTQPLHASPRSYVDNAINLAGNYLGTWSVAANSPNISAGGSISNANYVATTVNPATPEVVPVGVPGIAGLTVANGDRVIWASGLGTWQILRNAGVTLAAADARYVELTGDTMTGALTLPGNAASALQAVPLQQVPVASSTLPAMDGTASVGAGTTWAKADHIHPTDTTRASLAAVNAAAAAAANNTGRNLLHNSMFNVAQRGVGPFTAAGFTLDRWRIGLNTDTFSMTQTPFTDASRTAIGDEAAEFSFRNAFTGTAGAGAFLQLTQAVENVRRLAGKTVTVSFWAAGPAGIRLGINGLQYFGTGGSPSSAAYTQATGVAVTLTASFARYSVTLAIPSIVGKTLGTNNDHWTGIIFWYSSGASNNAAAGNIGVQSGAIDLWGVQCEIGSVATPLEKPDPQQDLANCQRFYQVGIMQVYTYSPVASGIWGANIFPFPVTMRAQPTVTPSWSSQVSCTGSIGAQSAGHYQVYLNVTATGGVNASGTFTASADL